MDDPIGEFDACTRSGQRWRLDIRCQQQLIYPDLESGCGQWMEFNFAAPGASRSAEVGSLSLCFVPRVRIHRQLHCPRFPLPGERLLAEVQFTWIRHIYGGFAFDRFDSSEDGMEHDRLDFESSRSSKHHPKPSRDRII